MNENWQAKFLWELLEEEAPQKFYVDGKENPAFLLLPRGHWASSKSMHTLYLNSISVIDTFTSEKKALERLTQIVENANFAVRVYRVVKYGRNRGKRILFAENTVERMDKTKLIGPARVFNIDEWQKEGEV